MVGTFTTPSNLNLGNLALTAVAANEIGSLRSLDRTEANFCFP